MPQSTTRRRWLLSAALPFLLLAVTLAGCVSIAGGVQPIPTPLAIPKVEGDPGVPLADVVFRASTDFYSALQLATNLGLQPVYDCTGYNYSDVRWQSQDERPRFAFAAQLPLPAQLALTPLPNSQPPETTTRPELPSLAVAPTPLAPSDWLRRLAALPSVVSIYTGGGACSLTREDRTPVPGVLYFLGQTAWVEYLRVSFAAADADGYGQALATISGLGFRLADPCYEQSVPPPAWRPVGQQASFASGGALVIAITAANSTQWLAQLKAAPGVVSVQAPYTQPCATP